MQYYGNQYFIQPFFNQIYFGSDNNIASGLNPIILPPSAQYMDGDYFFPYYNQSDFFDLHSYDPISPSIFNIYSYNPFSGVIADINVNPYVIFSSKPSSGSVLFTLKDSGNNNVPASLNFNPTTNTETMTPNSLLNYNTTYTAHIYASGTNGIVDFTWPFFTMPSSIPITSEHIIVQLPGKLLMPTRNMIINTDNIKQVIIYY